MIEPMWLKTQVLFNDVPTEVRPAALDVAVKLNEVIEAINAKPEEAMLEIEIWRPNKEPIKFYAKLDEGGYVEQTDNKTFKIIVKRLKGE